MKTFHYFNLFSTKISLIDRYNMFLFRDGSKSSSLLNSYDLILIKKKTVKDQFIQILGLFNNL